MLEHSFIFLDRINHASEQNIWKHAKSWEEFHAIPRIPGVSQARKSFYERRLLEAADALKEKDISFFSERLPQNQHWRLYDWLKEGAIFLDIETTFFHGDITVIGLCDGEKFKPLVRGFNLSRENFLEAIKDARLLITFNGASFDLPAIEKYFRMKIPNIPHIDLMHVCHKIGLGGGLKQIEKLIGIGRPELAADVSGSDAVWLWQEFQMTKDPAVLEQLIAYNQADVENMRTLAEYAIPRLWRKTHDGMHERS